MPQGRRKVPFSAKQKKFQLQEKRGRKKETADTSTEEHCSQVSSFSKPQLDIQTLSINEQPGSSTTNRYNLIFSKETNDEIKLQKEQARKSICFKPEVSREISYDEFNKDSLELQIEIPKRPPWDSSVSKAKLLAMEEKYFREYLNDLTKSFAGRLSHMELNLETWRQLWRVLEMSDIVFIIADVRHPVLHFSPSLFLTITKELKKEFILVLNKIDLVQPSLVLAWKQYFQKCFPSLRIICLTAYEPKKGKAQRKFKLAREIQTQIYNLCQDIVKDAVDLKSWEEKIANESEKSSNPHDDDDDDDEECIDTDDDDDDIENPLAKAESYLEEDVTSFFNYAKPYNGGILTMGFVGHPNVGKSSVLNAIMGKKVVSVSRTPGHTKHFQTIFLTKNVKLCDCPGLVFPSLAPRQLQVLSGCFPIAQVRVPQNVVGYIAQYISLPETLKLKHPNGDGEPWSAFDICEAYAVKKGFLTAKSGRPDSHRSANHLLRAALDGRTICLSFYPPGYVANKKTYEESAEISSICKQLITSNRELKDETETTSSEDEETVMKGANLNKFDILSMDFDQ